MTIVTLGPATLHLGDAYQLRPTLGFHDADVMDPPYRFRGTGAGRYRKRRPNMDRLIAEGLNRGFDVSIVNPLLCGGAVIFAHNDQLAELLTYVKGSFHRHALLVWQKTNPQPIANKHYRADCEFFLHAWHRGHHPQGELADKNRIRRLSPPRGAARYGHPTTKPDTLMSGIVANIAGESVCDPFMGTGSTGVAAIRAGKRFTGIEKDPAYFATAVKRIAAAVAELDREAA